MNKRGQIYIVAALILSVVIFILISQTNFVQQILIEDDFEQISQNFDIESAKFMNNLLAGGEIDMLGEFTDFTGDFTDYVKIENPEFEFICVVEYLGEKYVGYFLQTDVVIGPVTLATETIEGGIAEDEMSFTLSVTGDGEVEKVTDTSSIVIGDMKYTLNIQPGAPQIVIISREEKGEQTKVYLNEEFITGVKV